MASRITVCAPRPAPWFTPVFVAIDKGLFADEGLEPEIRYNVDLDQLGTGEADFVVTGAGRGRAFDSTSIRMICGHATRDTGHVLMVRPEFETVHALEHIVNLASVEKLLELTAAKLGSTPERVERFVDQRFLREALAK